MLSVFAQREPRTKMFKTGKVYNSYNTMKLDSFSCFFYLFLSLSLYDELGKESLAHRISFGWRSAKDLLVCSFRRSITKKETEKEIQWSRKTLSMYISELYKSVWDTEPLECTRLNARTCKLLTKTCIYVYSLGCIGSKETAYRV